MQNSSKKIIVVGAGIAGISSAVELAKNNFHVEVFESKKNIGGRAYSFQDRKTGEMIDNGQHLIMGAYSGFLSILNELGTASLLKSIHPFRIDFLDIDCNVDSLVSSMKYGKLSMALAILRLKSLSVRSKLSALLFASKLILGFYNDKDKNALDFLIEHSQNPRIIKYLWEPIILATLNCKAHNASAVLFVNVLKKAFFRDSKSSTILFPYEGLSSLLSTFEKFLLERNNQIYFSCGISKIHFGNNSIKSIETKTGEIHTADAYIFALPHNVLLNLLAGHEYTTDLCMKLKKYEFSTIISIYLWYDRNFIPQKIISLIGTKIQWVFNLRKLKNSSAEIINAFPGHITITISAANEFDSYSNDDILSVCLEELNNIIPETANAKLLHSLVLCNRRATFLATADQENRRLDNDTAIDNMFISGDWTNTGLSATIEGSVQSGLLAANKTQNYMLKL